MPEFNLIPEARSSPTSCYLCGEFAGPFVATNIDKIEGTVILCAPSYEPTGEVRRSGCVGGIAVAAGYVSPLEHAGQVDALAKLEVELRDAIAELEAELETASKPQQPLEVNLQPVIDRVDDLETRLRDALGKIEKPVAKPKPKQTAVAGSRRTP